ncbi:FAD-dependent oxidoreductase [Rhodococcus sp. HNM0569]|uniref:NAD(P)/FAD-dependent oxidoreductase n=1 Tax=Rhodococcus sp. HNM0569 TaxID=2716340 RepID=UPI00146BF567|nr:FAD-dependent oxidoreductase [Rhodococcus sp. HNM0569]NLU84529.1 FAD-dependent oxidoreductase [Rhodococcus sp. HNM0569]
MESCREDRSRRRVVVVGSGIAGLTAAHVLARRDHVTLVEADDRLGGHAHTHVFDVDGPVAVDSGFIVHNDRTYPTVQRLFRELGVETQETDMSMSVRCDDTSLEYAGARGLGGLFPTPANLFRPGYLAMLAEITRFHRRARALLHAPGGSEETLDEFLRRNGFGDNLVRWFVTPLVGAVWSCDAVTALRYPARYLFTFLEHHGMLTVFGSPTWRTVTGGSRRYVEAVAAGIDEVLVGNGVHSIRRYRDGVRVRTADGATRSFDAAVVATHPREALAMLDSPTATEKSVLGAIPYGRNHAQVHTDISLLPRAARARASWNCLIPSGRSAATEVLVTYDMTRLMQLPWTGRRFLVTLGGGERVAPDSVLAETTYEHPQYTPDSLAARERLPDLDSDTLAFAGAYHGWGFHEDGARSGVRAAARLGVRWGEPDGSAGGRVQVPA